MPMNNMGSCFDSVQMNIKKIIKVLGSRVADPHHFNAEPDPAFFFNAASDPDPAFHLNADPDPAPHQSYQNLRPLVYRPSKASF
jgi:hypothetical protein